MTDISITPLKMLCFYCDKEVKNGKFTVDVEGVWSYSICNRCSKKLDKINPSKNAKK